MPKRNLHRGDSGETRLLSGHRVRKDDPRIECMGSIDELSSFLGLARDGLEERVATAGVPEMMRMRLIGHEDEEVSRGYTHSEMQQAATVMAKVPAI